MTKQLKINPAPGSSAVRGAEWGAPQVSFPVFLSDSLRSYPWLPPTCWAWGQSDPQLVPVPPKIKARHTDYKVVQVGGGREGAKGTRVVGEMGGGGRLGRRHPGGDPGSPGPRSVPPNTSLWPVSRDRSPRGPGRSCPGAFGRGSGWTEPGAAGDGAGAWSTHLSPPPRSSRRLGAPQSPPGRPEGGREGKPANRGGPSAPASLRDPGAFLPPR